MRALRFYAAQDVRLEYDVPEPSCLAHQVKIRPSFCGICGSDLHEYHHQSFIPSKERPNTVTGEWAPIVFGHEFSGDVVEVGCQVDGLQVGDRVAVQPTVYCGKCFGCREGLLNTCDEYGFLGLSGGGGGLADFVCVDAQFAHKLPDNVPSDVGAVVEPLAVAWHAVAKSGMRPGDDVLVMGAGPIGLAVIQCLRAKQAKQIITVEISPTRKAFAAQFGATTVIDPSEGGVDVVTRCKQLCGGAGPAVAFDCAGVEASIKPAIAALRAKGLLINVALWAREIPFSFNCLLVGEKSITCSVSYTTTDFQSVVEALGSGAINPKDMITAKIRIDRVVEDGFQALMREKDKHVKILVDVRTPSLLQC